MGRLGVTEAETRTLAGIVAEGPSRLIGLMSHFATADEADTTFFRYQLERFAALAAEMKSAYPELICHTANSAATLSRAGLALRHGAQRHRPVRSRAVQRRPFKDDLRPAMTLKSYVAGVRIVQPGESVGYGRRFVADRVARVAIVPIGYADGIARRLTNRGDVLVAGRRCRIAGTISMDQLTVLLPEDHGREGDEVVFFGAAGGSPAGDRAAAARILCEEVARLLETINYEIVCDVSPRAVRRYRGAAPAAAT